MTKRYIFSELIRGLDDLTAAREGKLTLHTHRVEYKPIEPATGVETVALREKLQIYQGVFAQVIHSKCVTLKKWEQNRPMPRHLIDTHPK